eukprot:NODE_826_length_3671_cov_0.402296.p2 type:complete len:127 gc:universal NODE_826_length_3671_cov_0.402296:452-832(+)
MITMVEILKSEWPKNHIIHEIHLFNQQWSTQAMYWTKYGVTRAHPIKLVQFRFWRMKSPHLIIFPFYFQYHLILQYPFFAIFTGTSLNMTMICEPNYKITIKINLAKSMPILIISQWKKYGIGYLL